MFLEASLNFGSGYGGARLAQPIQSLRFMRHLPNALEYGFYLGWKDLFLAWVWVYTQVGEATIRENEVDGWAKQFS
jgi:hypothetical protein